MLLGVGRVSFLLVNMVVIEVVLSGVLELVILSMVLKCLLKLVRCVMVLVWWLIFCG